MASATAVLNLDEHTLTLRNKAGKPMAAPIPVQYRENESVDAWVARQAAKRGFSPAGEPFDYRNGFVYRLRSTK